MCYMKHIIVITAAIALSACSHPDSGTCDGMSQTPATGQKTVLIIGDSISLGYGPYVRAGLPNWDVQHAPCNSYGTLNQKENIRHWLTARPSWDAITFNAGMWDVWHGSGNFYTSPAEYEANLTWLAREIKANTAHPLFILSTDVPANTPYRTNAEIEARNTIALQVMQQEGIPVCDLYSVSTAIDSLHINALAADNVHWTPAGSEALAQTVLTSLNGIGVL